MSPLVSIIIPCFNQAQYLPDALYSVLEQTLSNWECIIVNDNSPDNTEQIANDFIRKDKRFKHHFLSNKGVAVARNEGIKMAEGNFILPLDADDKISPFYLEKAIKAFEDDSQIKVVYGNAEYFGDLSGKWDLADYNYQSLLLDNMIYCSGIFRKSDFMKVGGYSESLVHGLEDWDFWIRLLKEDDKVVKLSEVVFFYRKKAISRTTELIRDSKMEETQKEIISQNKDIYNEYLYQMVKELRDCKKAISELNSIKRSRTYKVVSKIVTFKNRILQWK